MRGPEMGAWLAPLGNDEEASVARAAWEQEKVVGAETIETAKSQLCRPIYAMVRALDIPQCDDKPSQGR